jgi:thiol-disulfide isomerase/thioredoxin
MRPLVQGLEKQYPGVEFRYLNVDGSDQEALALAQKLSVQYVPAFFFATKDGIQSASLVGDQTEQGLRENLDKLK